ncbi:MAG TPA: hypothetical protein VFX33_15365 [Actinomycetales bacterium]|nr:hypothetical protein [Actinomycetales bacterium]
MTGGLGDEAAKLVGRLLQNGLHSSRPDVLRHLAAAAGSVAAALEALAVEVEQARSEEEHDPEGPAEPGTTGPATRQRDGRVDVQKIDVTD